MGRTTSVVKRSGSAHWYARICIPKRHQATFNKREHWESLGTPNHQEAKRLALPIQMAWANKIAAADAELKVKRTLNETELQHAVWDHYSDILRADETRRDETLPQDTLSAIWNAAEEEMGGVLDL